MGRTVAAQLGSNGGIEVKVLSDEQERSRTTQITGREQLAADLRHLADGIEAGTVSGISVSWEPNGIGRICHTIAIGADDIELEGVELDLDVEGATPITAPGKKLKK